MYTVYHLHTCLSLLDSATFFSDYVARAKECGMTALGCSEHGINREWAANQLLCKQNGLKYLNGVEMYLTETLNERVRDNYHTILIAKNAAGRKELNNLVQLSTRDDHKYYNNRITFDEFLGISDNIIKISACIAGPLSKLPMDHPRYAELAQHYDYYEIQHHNTEDQIALNRKLLQLHYQFGKPLIAGTDTHSVNKYKAECRDILMEYKGQHYQDEEKFDLVWKTYDELVAAYEKQASLPMDIVLEAIENTNVMADSVEDTPIDTSIKYPILYGSRENDSQKFVELVRNQYLKFCESGWIKPEQQESFKKAIKEEMAVFEKLHMNGFLLTMGELIGFCRENNIPVGPARGSVSGSRVAYITGIVDLNPEDLNTVFSRFANEERVEIGDIDVDIIADDDRPKIFDYIQNRFGERYTARVGSYGTLADKAIIDCVGKVLHEKNPAKYSPEEIKEIKKLHEEDPDKTRSMYPDLFYYYDGLSGVTISQSVHPAGMVISPVDLVDEYGTMYKDGVQCLLLNMDATHDVGLAKFDFLGLKSVAVIRDTCELAGIPYPRYNDMDWHDQKVWDELDRDPTSEFQFESSFAAQAIKKFKPRSVQDLALISACLRPGGASYRDKVFDHIPNKNPTPEMDELFKDSLGYLVYQEQIIAALIKLCGFTGGQADSVRRDIAKKKEEKVAKDVVLIREGYCARSDKPREVAEKECADMLQVISDASGYSFNYNHAVAYSLVTYIFAWLRHYYPVQYITAFLNNANGDDDILTGNEMARERGIRIIPPKFGVSKDGYGCLPDQNMIAQGIQSIKGFGPGQGSGLYDLYHSKQYSSFVDVLVDIKENGIRLSSTLIEKLIQLDFFAEFGNQNELMTIKLEFDKWYGKKKISYEKEKDNALYNVYIGLVPPPQKTVKKEIVYGKTGTIEDMMSFLHGIEDAVKAMHLTDVKSIVKAKMFAEIMGFNGFVTGKQEDRPVLFVKSIIPLKSKKTGGLWAYLFKTQSLGSGIESTMTVRPSVYDREPVKEGAFVYCKKFYQDKNGYWNMSDYEEVVA